MQLFPPFVRPTRVLRPTRIWPKLFFAAGWVLFWLVTGFGERLPVPALFLGPSVMALALIFMVRKPSSGTLDKP